MYAFLCTQRMKREAAADDQSNAAISMSMRGSSISSDQDAETALDSLASFSTQGFTRPQLVFLPQ
jgi:hypothetical protein